MKPDKQPPPTIVAASGIAKISDILIITISLLSLFGWATGVRQLTSWGTAYKPMATSSTFLFLLFGTLLLLNTLKPQWKFVLALMALISLATIGHSLTIFTSTNPIRSIMDLILAKKSLTFLSEYSGYMSPLTAVGWIVASLSLIRCLVSFTRRLTAIIADFLTIVLFFFGLTCTIGYLYGMPFLYGSTINPTALPTSFLFMLLAVSLLMHHPDKSEFMGLFIGPSIQSRLLRLFLPVMMVLMTATGWFFSRFPPNVSGMNPAIVGSLSTTGVLLFIGILITTMARLAGRDIEAVQQKIRENEAMLNRSQQVATLGHYNLTIDTGFWTSSEMLNEIFGISADFTKNVAGWLKIVHPEQREEIADYFAIHVLRDKNRFDREYKIERQNDGTTRWVHGFGDLEFDAHGKPIRMFGVVQDITEQKRGEDALRESTAKLETLIQVSPLAILAVDLNGNVQLWNSSAERTFGWSAQEVNGKPNPLVPASKQNEYVEWSEQITKGKVINDQETIRRRKDGSLIAVSVSSSQLNDGAGNIMGRMAIITDITARKQSEEQILRQNRFLLDVLNSLTHPFYVIDAETYNIIMANPASNIKASGENNTCYNLTHGMNKPCNTSNHPCPITEVKKNKNAIVVEHIHFDKDHKTRNFEIHAYPIFNDLGEVSQIIEYSLDITEHRLAEERYRSIFENAAEGIFQSTPEGQFISVNPAFAQIYGYESPQEVISTIQDISRQMYTDPKKHEEIIALLWKQSSVKNFEAQHYRKDGSIIWVTINIHVCRNRLDYPLFFEGTIQDVTDNKKLEAQLLQSQKMEAVGKLAGGIAHDFNNLLTSIIGNTELLIYKRKRKDDISHRLNTIRETADRAAQLTRQLLMLSRRQISNSKVLNLNEVVAGMQRMLERILGEDIQCQFSPEPVLWAIKADAMSIEQVFLNLVVNARQAMPQGGVLKIRTANVTAREIIIPSGVETSASEFVLIEISDTGIGIPNEIIKDIFEPFFTTKAGGTGLGLSIVYGIVKQSGGFIKITSEIGKGTSIRIHFPAVKGSASSQEIKTTPQKLLLPKGTETILIVEDNIQILEMIRIFLLDLNYTILSARSGEEALEIIKKEGKKIDLVFTDIVLPGIHGGQVAEVVKNAIPKAKILFTSGYQDDRISLTKIITGPVSFIEKPFKPMFLALKIREMLDSAHI
jgi:two-component system cell cycle sensor histidine kinase/response regulator CckA